MKKKTIYNNIVFLVIDNCRYDSFVFARPDPKQPYSKVEKRYSNANWSIPSLASMLTGMLPFEIKKGPQKTLTDDIEIWKEMAGHDFSWGKQWMWLPHNLQEHSNYYTLALSSISLFSPRSIFNTGFDQFIFGFEFTIQDKINWMIRTGLETSVGVFCFMFTHEARFPYGHIELAKDSHLRDIKRIQAGALRAKIFPALDMMLTRLPKGTWVIITGDHGEVCGENDMYGHGHQIHEKVFEVPYVRFQV